MKISVQQLQPNPYRDLARYPLHRQKIEALKASIRSTGFWDNLLVRPAPEGNGFELAYGHHRYEALKELLNEDILEKDFAIDVPVRKLDDATMIRIMANENVEEFRVTAEIIDDTVRVAREFIMRETKTPAHEITASDISQFLGGAWNEDKVSTSLQRLSLFDRGTLKREQLKGLSHSAARSIQREVARVEKTMARDEMDRLDESDDEDLSENDRKRVRAQVQKVAGHVAQVLSDHLRNGGSMSEAKERAIEAQIEMLPEDAPPEQRRLSTIDAAARAVNARDFERKIELLMKYRDHMSPDIKVELANKLRDLEAWCSQMVEQLES